MIHGQTSKSEPTEFRKFADTIVAEVTARNRGFGMLHFTQIDEGGEPQSYNILSIAKLSHSEIEECVAHILKSLIRNLELDQNMEPEVTLTLLSEIVSHFKAELNKETE